MQKRSKSTWIGLSLCVVIVVAWIVSCFLAIGYQTRSSWGFGVSCGCAAVAHETNVPQGIILETRPRELFWLPPSFPGVIAVPLWMLFVPTATFTIWSWQRDRRPLPDHCQTCGYNLTGNVTGTCPECGFPDHCQHCGYNLTGNTTGQCPECGETT